MRHVLVLRVTTALSHQLKPEKTKQEASLELYCSTFQLRY